MIGLMPRLPEPPTPPPAGVDATAPTPADVGERARRRLLSDAIATQPGPWTTGRAHRLYRGTGIAPGRRTARCDLAHLARTGLLTRTEQPGRRTYTRKDTR